MLIDQHSHYVANLMGRTATQLVTGYPLHLKMPPTAASYTADQLIVALDSWYIGSSYCFTRQSALDSYSPPRYAS